MGNSFLRLESKQNDTQNKPSLSSSLVYGAEHIEALFESDLLSVFGSKCYASFKGSVLVLLAKLQWL